MAGAAWSVINCFDPTFCCCFQNVMTLSVWTRDHWWYCNSPPEFTFVMTVPHQKSSAK